MLGDLSFDEARTALRAAIDYFELAKSSADELLKDRHAREAFDTLFQAARIASMVFLSTENSRWGSIRRMLPEPYKGEFKRFIEVLHLEYFYHGKYPKELLDDEFAQWKRKVGEFINELESETKRE